MVQAATQTGKKIDKEQTVVHKQCKIIFLRSVGSIISKCLPIVPACKYSCF